MPVPVPLYNNSYSAHKISKPRLESHDLTPFRALFPALDNGAKYVIHPQDLARPAASIPLDSQASRTQHEHDLSHCIGDRLNSAIHFVESQHPAKTADSKHGLTPAADAGFSQQGHAEACSLPARGTDHPNMTISSHIRASSDVAWSGYDAVDGMHAAVYAAADAKGWAPPLRVNGAFVYGDEPAYHPSFDGAEQVYGCEYGQQSSTPFAEFVDRMVASEASLTSEHVGANIHQSQPELGSPIMQQRPAVPTEPLSNPAYIKAYRSMAEPLSTWIATYIWKACTSDVGLAQRFGGAL